VKCIKNSEMANISMFGFIDLLRKYNKKTIANPQV